MWWVRFNQAVAVALCLCFSPGAARAVVIASGDGSGNTTATGSFADPFAHVGNLLGNSGVYLGHGVVLSANHATNSNPSGTFYFGGHSASLVSNTKTRLHVPGVPSSLVDLSLHYVKGYSGLGSLNIGAAVVGNTVRMAGNGFNRATALSGWASDWDPVTPASSGYYQGYNLLTSQSVRWGENVVQIVAGSAGTINNTLVKYTVFNQAGGLTHEAQAVGHDSGSGVFKFNGSTWDLVGINVAISVITGQPNYSDTNPNNDTAVFGNVTAFADLIAYVDQINAYIAVVDSFLGDANHDGVVNGNDYLAVEWNFGQTGLADGTLPGDANHDGRVDGRDYMMVEQNEGQTLAALLAGASLSPDAIPEPASLLFLLTAAPLLAARRRRLHAAA